MLPPLKTSFTASIGNTRFSLGWHVLRNRDTDAGRPRAKHKSFLAPIRERPGRVLDVGTGTRIWAIDFAAEFPETEVTAVDISPIQPSWVPPNLKFEVGNMNLEWL